MKPKTASATLSETSPHMTPIGMGSPESVLPAWWIDSWTDGPFVSLFTRNSPKNALIIQLAAPPLTMRAWACGMSPILPKCVRYSQ